MRVFIIAAITADGYIARDSGHKADWTSSDDKKLFVQLTKEAGVMVMGSSTFLTIGKALPGRRSIVYTTRPEQITTEGIETTNESPRALIARLEAEGEKAVAVIGGSKTYDLFMRAGVVEEIYLTVEPKLFGTGLPLFASELDINLSLQEVRNLNQRTVLLHYAVDNNTEGKDPK